MNRAFNFNSACRAIAKIAARDQKNKATIERETLISRPIGELNRPLGKDVLAEVMMELRTSREAK